MKLVKLLLAVLSICLLAQSVAAGSGQIILLATSERLEEGITAELFLETRPGTGKIFIESSPLSKVDTQISTKFAKEVACNYLGRSCDEMDFFYTIKARATIIGGPSAGAAMTALTVAVLENAELNRSVTVTGTINSGNIIGPVGRVSKKIEAAGKAGIKKVLIPKGDHSSFSGNSSTDVTALGRELGVEVVEVFEIDEALLELTGRNFGNPNKTFGIDPRYSEVMGSLADSLCSRAKKLASGFEEFRASDSYNRSMDDLAQHAENLSMQGAQAESESRNYAAASFCFGANIRYRYFDLVSRDLENEEVLSEIADLERMIAEEEAGLRRSLTVSDVQVLAVVEDRLSEAAEKANSSRAALATDAFDSALFELAFAIERLESARAWSAFFGVISEVEIDVEAVKGACEFRMGEAIERAEYASILTGRQNNAADDRLRKVEEFFDDGEYAQCLHQATISKAESNLLLSVLGVEEDELGEIVERKISAAETTIARQTEKKIFPIVGYSYFEYASLLKDSDPVSALLFSEYALEFSNLDIYFKSSAKEKKDPVAEQEPGLDVEEGLIGFIAGIAVLLFAMGRILREKERLFLKKPRKKSGK